MKGVDLKVDPLVEWREPSWKDMEMDTAEAFMEQKKHPSNKVEIIIETLTEQDRVTKTCI
jgi:hypothetical protein